MPSLIDIRRRIRSVKNTQQITKAMKMVSAAKLRRAQDRVISARPYGKMLDQVLGNVAQAAAETEKAGEQPLLAVRPENRIQLLVITADRGLSGGFNSNLIKTAQKFIDQHRDADIRIEALGRKSRDYFRKRTTTVSGEHTGLEKVKYEQAAAIARRIIERFENEEIDAVYLAGNEFKSVMAANLVLQRILPIHVPQNHEAIDYIYEQSPAELLKTLLPRYVEVRVYRALLESEAAEHAARMTAMEAATSNAGEVIDKLTLYMNRVRQASITKEIIEVVSGAAALE